MQGAHEAAGASPWVARFLTGVGQGRALDVACGSGRHARMMLAAGHRVTVLDIDLGGVADLLAEVEAHAVDLESADPEGADPEGADPEGADPEGPDPEGAAGGADPWPLGDRRFDVVVVTNYLWRPLFPRLLQSVAVGGRLIYETFAVGQECWGRPRNPDFLLAPNELLERVGAELTIGAFEQGTVGGEPPRVVQRIYAVRPAPGHGPDLAAIDL